MDPATITMIKSQSPHASRPSDEIQQSKKDVAVAGDFLDERQGRMSAIASRKEGTSSRPSPLEDYARAIGNVVDDLDKDEADISYVHSSTAHSLAMLSNPAPARPTSKASLSSQHGCVSRQTKPQSQDLSAASADNQFQQTSSQASGGRQLTAEEFEAMIDKALFPNFDDTVVNDAMDFCLDPPDETVLLSNRCLQTCDASAIVRSPFSAFLMDLTTEEGPAWELSL